MASPCWQVFLGSCDSRISRSTYLIDQGTPIFKTLKHSNEGATEKQQKLVARTTSALGAVPRTSGAVAMLQAAPMHTPQEQVVEQLLRACWAMEQYLTAAGIDMTKAPTELAPEQPAIAPPPQQTPFGSGASRVDIALFLLCAVNWMCAANLYLSFVASGAFDAQGAAQGNHGEDDSSGVEGVGPGADANDDDDDSAGGATAAMPTMRRRLQAPSARQRGARVNARAEGSSEVFMTSV